MLVLQTPAQPSTPIIVKIIQVPSHTLGDVVMAALGISGVLLLGAVVLGFLLGVCFVAVRLRRRRQHSSDASTDHQQLHLNA